MSAAQSFWKYHGLGNDFILVDLRGRANLSPESTQVICDRHLGIGGDGILALMTAPGGLPMMRVFNADGSVADMCGNGLRCFVRWLVEHKGFPATEEIVVATDAGEQRCIPIVDAGGIVSDVQVDLGAATFADTTELHVMDRVFKGEDLFLGNPHFVILRAPENCEAAEFGPSISTHSHFPRDTNVEWLEVVSPTHANVVVYERGCGLTQACGTGGAAAVAVGVRLGKLGADSDVTVMQPGGRLVYRVESATEHVWMTGPATPVFSGESLLIPTA